MKEVALAETPVTAAVPSNWEEVDLSFSDDGIALLRLAPATRSEGGAEAAPAEQGRAVVTLTMRRMKSLERAVETLRARPGLRGVVVAGPDEGMFAAGADIHAILEVKNAAEAEGLSRTGQEVFGRLAQLPVPTVAAIGGPCLGGGLELALALTSRVAVDRPDTRIGLPEVKLGILPGFGGTVRLPRLVGLPRALDLILTGRTLDARQALRKGVVDRVVPQSFLLEKARDELARLIAAGAVRRKVRLPLSERFLSGPGRFLVVRSAGKKIAAGGGHWYPAPRRALEVTVAGTRLPEAEALAQEARALGELLASTTSRRLTNLFLETEKARKLHERMGGGRKVERALVIGAGVMGSGIAALMARKGIWVRVVDLSLEALAKATSNLAKDLSRRKRQKKLTAAEARACLDRWTASTELSGSTSADLVLEAAAESLPVKQGLFSRLSPRLVKETVLATNTSSLSVAAIAKSLTDPGRMVGIHFFNPPDKMPLVEVVRGEDSAAEAVCLALRLASDLGKFPIVVRDRPGFLVNRCLAPYLNEAAHLLVEGVEPETLDRVLVDFGFPMGPARLLDEVGWDIAANAGESLLQAFGERMAGPPLAKLMVEARILGNKSGGGLYEPGDRSGQSGGSGRAGKPFAPGRAVLARLRRERGRPPSEHSPEDILDRCLLPLISEALRCLDEGVAEDENQIDMAMVLGIGFPPFRGGPFAYARERTWRAIVDRLDDLARRAGPRLTPGDGLRRRALQEAGSR